VSTLRYPMLCWELSETLVAGVIPGEGLELIRSDVRKLKAALADELKREDCFRDDPLEEPRHRCFVVPFRPAWRQDGKTFPLTETVEVSVDALYGRNDVGSYTCHLPRLGCVFYFYEPDQIETMVVHFARDALRNLSPEALYRHLLAPPARMELITLHSRPRPPRKSRSRPSTPRLNQIAEPLPAPRRAGQLRAAWQRSDEVRALCEVIVEQPRSSVLLIGAPGVGKSTVITEAIRQVSRTKTELTFWRTAARRLVSGARYLGDWQLLCEQLVEELESVNGVLWVEGIGELLHTGGSGPEDSVAAFFRPTMAAGRLRLIGELTERGLDAARAVLPDFIALLTAQPITELPPAAMADVLGRFGEYAERNLSVSFTPAALRLASRLLERHIRYERFPGKAIRFLTAVTHHARLEGLSEVDEHVILDRFIARTGMPRPLLDDRIALSDASIQDWFSRRIIGQPDAITEAARVVKVFKTGLSDPDRPIATLLFVGPTGVGKTAMARALTGYFFGETKIESALIRIDMSELQLPGQLQRLIGGPDGTPGELIRRLRERPFSVVLFDEIEKANPIFFDTLLTVLDEGILADSLGRETDFRSSVIIMTSNLGASKSASAGFSRSTVRNDLGAVRAFFRPEFFNRIDRIVQFAPLPPQDIQAIARLELAGLTRREGITSRGLRLIFTDALVDLVARLGFNSDYGARALQRVIEGRVVSALAAVLLEAPALRDTTLIVEAQADEVLIRR
jgi:ATP-dependent Clp protease ATP-binding subunit ClpC